MFQVILAFCKDLFLFCDLVENRNATEWENKPTNKQKTEQENKQQKTSDLLIAQFRRKY